MYMAGKKKSNKRNNRNRAKKSIEQMHSVIEKEVFKVIAIIVGVLLFLAIFYFITVGIVSDKEETDNKEQTAIQYEQILAGSSFNMKDSEYLVVYFDFSDEELSELTEAVDYGYSGINKLYKVDMNDGFNKKYMAEENLNKQPSSASELTINGPTLIKIVDRKCVEYVEGMQEIIDYLS